MDIIAILLMLGHITPREALNCLFWGFMVFFALVVLGFCANWYVERNKPASERSQDLKTQQAAYHPEVHGDLLTCYNEHGQETVIDVRSIQSISKVANDRTLVSFKGDRSSVILNLPGYDQLKLIWNAKQ